MRVCVCVGVCTYVCGVWYVVCVCVQTFKKVIIHILKFGSQK